MLTMISNAVDSTLASISVTQAFLAIVTVGVVIRWASKQKKNLPPGPPPLPLFGNVFDLKGKLLHKKTLEWKEKYGPVFLFYSGLRPTVVISSIETMTEAYIQRAPDFANKPALPSFDFISEGGQNITFGNYSPENKLRRKIAMQALRQYLTGTQHVERVHEVVKMTVANMTKEKGPFDPQLHMAHNVFNILHNICFGYTRTIDDPKFLEILHMFDETFTRPSTFWEDFFPFLTHYPTKDYQAFKADITKMKDYVSGHVQASKATFDPNSTKKLIDSILLAKKMADEGDRDDVKATKAGFTDLHINQMVTEVFIAGVDTTRNTLAWAFLLLATKPELQKKVQKEIDDIVGDGVPGREHRQDLVYTEAFIMEVMRMFPVAPMGLPHETSCETQVGGYEIPAKTQVLVNQYAILNDPKHWENPEKFMPERFLEEGGEKLKLRPKSFIPFSMGQRNCVGEFLAKKNLLYTVAGLLQKLSFSMAPGTEPDFNPRIDTFVLSPRKNKLVATPRN